MSTPAKYRVALVRGPGTYSPIGAGQGFTPALDSLARTIPSRGHSHAPPSLPVAVLVNDEYHSPEANRGPFALSFEGSLYRPVEPDDVDRAPSSCTLRAWKRAHVVTAEVLGLLEECDMAREKSFRKRAVKLDQEGWHTEATKLRDAAEDLAAGREARAKYYRENLGTSRRLSLHPDFREAVEEALGLEYCPAEGCWDGLVGVFPGEDDETPRFIVLTGQVFELGEVTEEALAEFWKPKGGDDDGTS